MRAKEEQEKSVAHFQGVSAFRAGSDEGANPYKGVAGKEHQEKAWDRGWHGERNLRSIFR